MGALKIRRRAPQLPFANCHITDLWFIEAQLRLTFGLNCSRLELETSLAFCSNHIQILNMATSVDAKLLKQTKFPPEFNQKVDMKKVNVEVMKK